MGRRRLGYLPQLWRVAFNYRKPGYCPETDVASHHEKWKSAQACRGTRMILSYGNSRRTTFIVHNPLQFSGSISPISAISSASTLRILMPLASTSHECTVIVACLPEDTVSRFICFRCFYLGKVGHLEPFLEQICSSSRFSSLASCCMLRHFRQGFL